jgi:hypothetical protein
MSEIANDIKYETDFKCIFLDATEILLHGVLIYSVLIACVLKTQNGNVF